MVCITATDVWGGGAGGRGLQGSLEELAMPREWAAARVCVCVCVCARTRARARLGPHCLPDLLLGAFTASPHVNPTTALRGCSRDYSHDTDEKTEAQRQEELSNFSQWMSGRWHTLWSEIPLISMEPPSLVSQRPPNTPGALFLQPLPSVPPPSSAAWGFFTALGQLARDLS